MVIVAITEGDVIFVEQYRRTIGQRVLECPAGVIEGNESPADATRRELREEIGYSAGSVERLYTHNPLPGLLRCDLSIVFAGDLSPGATERDEGEFLTTRTVPVAEAIETARNPPSNGMTLPALLLAREAGLV